MKKEEKICIFNLFLELAKEREIYFLQNDEENLPIRLNIYLLVDNTNVSCKM